MFSRAALNIVAAIVCCAALAVPALVQAANNDPVVATLASPDPGALTGVSAYGNRVVWSDWDGSSYRLMTSAGGRVEALAVGTNDKPFDVDLGPGPDGKPVAAYTRCRGGCTIYLYDFAAGAERAVRKLNGGRVGLPSIWRDRIAFADPDGTVYLAKVKGTAAARTLANISRRVCGDFGTNPGRHCYDNSDPRVASLDLRGEMVAVAQTVTRAEGSGTSDDKHQLIVTAPGRKYPRVIEDKGVGLGSPTPQTPTWDGSKLYWALGCYGDTSGCRDELRRVDLRNGRVAQATLKVHVTAQATTAGRSYYVTNRPGFGPPEPNNGPVTELQCPPTPAGQAPSCTIRRAQDSKFTRGRFRIKS